MGKDKKSKAAEKKARTAQKQEKKAGKKEKKQKSRGKQDADSDAEDVDLDAILAEYAKQQEQFLKVTEEISEPPSARSSATFLGSPGNDNELFVFGGEYFNGSLAQFYNDLFVYNVNRDEWKRVTSPNSPLPRSGHAWCRGGNAGGVYLFGGEFSSPKQGTFYHYNDFWRLEPGTREWTRIEGKGKASSPPSRSGHRMTYFKNYIILFGGFQDTSQTTKYLNDLWIYDCTTYAWHEPKIAAGTGKPDARSSFSLLPHESGAVLYGGYSRVKSASAAQKKVKGGTRPGSNKVTLKPVIHQDTWFLRITSPAADAPSGTLPVLRWERRKRPANAPNPTRAGATMCSHRGRGILFGGVHDVEESEEGMDSEFFNALFAWNVDRNRYFQLTLRRPKTSAKKAGNDRGRRDRGKQAEEELLRNLKALEMGAKIDDESVQEQLQAAEDKDTDQPERSTKVAVFEMPHPRFNAQLTVQGDMLYIFGGTFEKGDQEYTLDEMWAVDLNKLDGVREIYKRELQDWQVDEESEDEEDEDEDEESHEEYDEDEDNASTVAESVSTALTSTTVVDEETAIEESSSFNDGLPFPRPFESLREFFDRTKIQWQEVVIVGMDENAMLAPKEISKKGFERAENKWWDCREEIRTLEDEQIEAGIGEVISLADKDGGASGAGRRR